MSEVQSQNAPEASKNSNTPMSPEDAKKIEQVKHAEKMKRVFNEAKSEYKDAYTEYDLNKEENKCDGKQCTVDISGRDQLRAREKAVVQALVGGFGLDIKTNAKDFTLMVFTLVDDSYFQLAYVQNDKYHAYKISESVAEKIK